MLLLEHSPLEFHRPITTHALNHDSVCVWIECHARCRLLLLVQGLVYLVVCIVQHVPGGSYGQHLDSFLINQRIGRYL